MAEHIYLVQYNQEAEDLVTFVSIDRIDAVIGLNQRRLLNNGCDNSGWRTIAYAATQQEAHQKAEDFLQEYFTQYPERFPSKGYSMSHGSTVERGFVPGTKILQRQTYK